MAKAMVKDNCCEGRVKNVCARNLYPERPCRNDLTKVYQRTNVKIFPLIAWGSFLYME
jgi:hypothetical protein